MNWTIERLDALPTFGNIENYCVSAYWRVTHAEDGFSATRYGVCSFAVPEVAPKKAAPFETLTEQKVLGWVWANGVDREAYEQSMLAAIEAQRNPPVVSPPLPWAQ